MCLVWKYTANEMFGTAHTLHRTQPGELIFEQFKIPKGSFLSSQKAPAGTRTQPGELIFEKYCLRFPRDICSLRYVPVNPIYLVISPYILYIPLYPLYPPISPISPYISAYLWLGSRWDNPYYSLKRRRLLQPPPPSITRLQAWDMPCHMPWDMPWDTLRFVILRLRPCRRPPLR